MRINLLKASSLGTISWKKHVSMHPPQHDRLSWEPAPRPRSAPYLFILDRFSGFYMSAAFNYDELAPSPVSNDREAGGDQTRHRFRSWWRVWPVKLQACLSLRVLGPDYYARISQHSASHEAYHSPTNPPLLGESRPVCWAHFTNI